MPTSSVTLAKVQKVVPAAVLKQLRAAAAIKCYDHAFTEESMTAEEMKRLIFNMYHGNDEKNIISQVALLINGKGDYSNMYDISAAKVTGASQPDELDAGTNTEHTLKGLFYSPDVPFKFISGTHFTNEILRCPTKNMSSDKCSGRFLLDLAKSTITNIKNAVVLAEEWLDDGALPSGKSWEDLYAHLLSRHADINSKEEIFTGFINFVCDSKYNENQTNRLNILTANDDGDDDCAFGGKGRKMKARQISLKVKEETVVRSIETTGMTSSPFVTRGLTLESRIQIIELAQVEDSKVREQLNQRILQLMTRNKLLLDERQQEIELAKIICPEYDASDSNWMKVMHLKEEITQLKREIKKEEEEKGKLVEKSASSNLASAFLKSVCTSSPSLPPTKKPRIDIEIDI